ncbi:protein of unknown function [Candidatus Filomicrobium marinum]|uniref:Uncharacterized protein n=1 Tax=Candidatus Filomicrobium marinum TaxID=1608628 RepID=A0A0D6JG83_9HYPH|nr:hypothetical protein [Candidatus Filomicrobium marinum]CFX25290.1 protein of unknown function [Candidatus Filomicrobium marinum]CPR19276.1 protein of unknown function [Candidatus Filomicrobium marinum]
MAGERFRQLMKFDRMASMIASPNLIRAEILEVFLGAINHEAGFQVGCGSKVSPAILSGVLMESWKDALMEFRVRGFNRG